MLDQGRLFAVAEAARQQAHRGLAQVALGRRLRRRLGWRELLRLGGLMAGERVLELPHPRAQRASDLRQPLGAEEEQRDQEQDDDVRRAGPAAHTGRVARLAATNRGISVW